MNKKYRKLTGDEIIRLERQFCIAEDWNNITVAEAFTTDYISNVTFSGTIKLGVTEDSFTLPGGIKKHSQLKFATLHNVTVGDNCCIEKVQNYIANYEIGDNTLIENIGIMYVDRLSTFGNGVAASVLNETGGREVYINDKLSAHQAYIIALYRHRPKLIQKLREITDYYSNKHASTVGTTGSFVRIKNADVIKNVRIGDYCSINGASRLENGSINSNEAAPVLIGANVICEDFIISSGSSVTDGTTLSRCFVGQACLLGHNYSASDSLFFSNCQGENGEACAIFAGPFTVTHHKSTLLIAGMFSFMNAGSGSNQSNHMYKLGPIHQGTLERGQRQHQIHIFCGRHVSEPFLWLWEGMLITQIRRICHSRILIEQGNTTYLVPGVNLRSVGTIRDAQKWPKRDKRADPNRLDFINYNLLSPYTIQKMMKGRQILKDLIRVSGETSELYSYQSAKIKSSSLFGGIKFYETAIHKFMGNSIIKRLEGIKFENDAQIRERLKPESSVGIGDWVDIAGLIAPQSEIGKLLNGIENGDINKLKDINAHFARMNDNYYNYEWTWAYSKIEEVYGINPEAITAKNIVDIVKDWQEAVIGLDHKIYDDARKEFSMQSMTGFGVDGTRDTKIEDFECVRGDFENNTFVRAILKHIEDKQALGDELIARLKGI
jgi:acetyltransferase-like isoleucine patch superfamily enzyme